jgi:enhanced entry protein EnhC
MKSIVPWFCLLAVSSSSVIAAGNALEAYRSGHYVQAADKFLDDAKPGAVGHDYLGTMYLYGYGVLKNNQRALQNLRESASRGYLPAQKIAARYALIQDNNPEEALKWFKKAAEAGDLKAQLYCAAAYHFGVGVRKNEDKARRYDILAAKQGNSLGQASLAEHFIESRHSSNKRLGMIWVNRAVEQKEPLGLYVLADVYAEGKLVPKDLDKAKALYDSALSGGYLPAMLGLAALAKQAKDETLEQTWKTKYEEATQKIPNTPEALAARWLTRGKMLTLAKSGYGLDGIFTSWSDKLALQENQYNQPPQMAGISRKTLYKPRFKLVEPNSIPLTDYYDVLVKAASLQDNKTTDKSENKNDDFPVYPLAEKKWTALLEERASLGDPTAQFALGQLYQQGTGVKQDMEKSVAYYMQAVAQQDLKAEYTLGLFYLKGDGGQPDYKQAMGWLNDAAFKGNPEAQYVLGRLLEEGIQGEGDAWVIKPDKDRAMSMYALASFNQLPKGQYHLAEMLVRDKKGSLSVQEKQKRHALMKRLYQGAASKGVQEAVLPLAFFDAMDASKEKQAHALEVAKKEAKSGSQEAALLYGMLLDRGIGCEPDTGDAVYWYKKAKSNPVSAFMLGTYYAEGREVGKNQEKAAILLREAAQAGFSFADLNAAVLQHERGLAFMPALEKAHQLGNAQASLLLADYSLTRADNADQMKQARVIYQDLAERGDREAQLKLGYLLEQGLGGVVNVKEAAHWYELSGNQKQPVAQYLLGRLNQLGKLDTLPDYAASKVWYQRAMKNYAPAAIALGFVYETVDNNYTKASEAYEVASNKKNLIGAFDLGLMYEYGKGRPVDIKQAENLYFDAAEQGHTRAMVQLAGIYLRDTGMFGSQKKAVAWYRKAAERGDRNAMYQLGYLAEKGIGMSKDIPQALKDYQAAADKGNAQAVLALARLYQDGVGVQKNAEKAASLYQKLADRGNGYAQYHLAMLYYQGALGDVNQEKAKRWLKQAGSNGCRRAAHTLQWLNAEASESTSFIEPLSLGIASAWLKPTRG